MKSWFQDNDIEMSSKHIEGTCVAGRYIRTFKNKICKYITTYIQI